MILRKARKHLAVTAGRTPPGLLARQMNSGECARLRVCVRTPQGER